MTSRAGIIAVLYALSVTAVAAQINTGEISGVVRDSVGGVLPGAQVINPSVDSIEEFKIQKSMYPAEFGGKASALINVVTRRCEQLPGERVRVLSR